MLGATWDEVQAGLAQNATQRRHRSNAGRPSLLTGLLHDGLGRPMKPAHATKAGRRYRYYITRPINDSGSAAPWRLPALALEDAVVHGIGARLWDGHRLVVDLEQGGVAADSLAKALDPARHLADRLARLAPADQAAILHPLIVRIDLAADQIRVQARPSALLAQLGLGATRGPASRAGSLTWPVPIQLRRRGVETRLVLGADSGASAQPDQTLIRAIARAHRWFAALRSGEVASVKALAAQHRIDRAEASRILRLALLAPDIVTAILDGRQPVGLTLASLTRGADLPVSWAEQRRRLGFA